MEEGDDDGDDDGLPRTEEELRKKYFGGGSGGGDDDDKGHNDEKTRGNASIPCAPSSPPPLRKAEIHCGYMLPTLLSLAQQAQQQQQQQQQEQQNPSPNPTENQNKKSPPPPPPHLLQILDIGCGSGEITLDFAEMCPFAHVTGIDVSGAVLDSARAYAELRGVTNVEFVQMSVFSMPVEWKGRFHVVHTHQAVAHFGGGGGGGGDDEDEEEEEEEDDSFGGGSGGKMVQRGIREMIRVARRSGGVVCMREGNLQSARFHPEYPLLEECFQVIIAVHEAGGGAADAGRQLKRWSKHFRGETKVLLATQSASRYDTPEGRRSYGGHWPARCSRGIFAQRAMELRGVSSQRLDEYALAWKEWMEDEKGMFAMMHGEVILEVT